MTVPVVLGRARPDGGVMGSNLGPRRQAWARADYTGKTTSLLAALRIAPSTPAMSVCLGT